jgi:FkbM family methyltransferase
MASLQELLGFQGLIHIADIGAATINEIPPYRPLLQHRIGRLSAFDGDERHRDEMVRYYGPLSKVYTCVVADGRDHILHLATAASGMASILAPFARNLAFFTGLGHFGRAEREVPVSTVRLQDIEGLSPIDFLKMDIQGAELMVLENAGPVLDQCVAIQLEASFIPLYEGQPNFGEIDLWMRRAGYMPHCFVDVKRWPIAPLRGAGDELIAFNQLLECDIVYVRGLVSLDGLSDDQLRKIALISALCYRSPDLCLHVARELQRRGQFNGDLAEVVRLCPRPPPG